MRADLGAARTEAGFAIAAALGIGIVAVLALVTEAPEASPRAPATVDAVVAADLMTAGTIRQFTAAQVQARLQTLLNPAERTDAQLRNAHRIWTARVGDQRYPDQDLAHDMALIVAHAMQARGVTPHRAP